MGEAIGPPRHSSFSGGLIIFDISRGTSLEANLLDGSTVLPEKVRREAGFKIVAGLLLLAPLAVMFCGTPSNTRSRALEGHRPEGYKLLTTDSISRMGDVDPSSLVLSPLVNSVVDNGGECMGHSL